MEVVGQNDLGGRGFNADVWVHEGYAYVGHWGFSDWASGSKTRFCPSPPNNGVAVVDVSDPANPDVVSRLVNPTGTSAEDVTVFQARFGPLAGRDIAAIGLQVCGGSRLDTSFARGADALRRHQPGEPRAGRLSEHRLLHPRRPRARVRAPCGSRTDVRLRVGAGQRVRGDGLPERVPRRTGPGRLPAHRRDEPRRRPSRCPTGASSTMPAGRSTRAQGCDPDPVYGHSVEPLGRRQARIRRLLGQRLRRPRRHEPRDPVLRGHTVYGTDEDGDAHSSMYDDARRLLFSADEDFGKNCGPDIEPGYGYLRIWDYSNLAAPMQIGEYRTPNSGGPLAIGSGDYTIHNPMLMGTDVYISWYSDGVRVVDASDPDEPGRGRVLRPAGGPEPGEAGPARNALPDATGLGRLRRRGDRSRLRERHEHRPLDPQANRLRGDPSTAVERRPSGRRSAFRGRFGPVSPRRGIFRHAAQSSARRGVCACTGSNFA